MKREIDVIDRNKDLRIGLEETEREKFEQRTQGVRHFSLHIYEGLVVRVFKDQCVRKS